jgi:hypothetical protein
MIKLENSTILKIEALRPITTTAITTTMILL